jgi:hypothetical protein
VGHDHGHGHGHDHHTVVDRDGATTFLYTLIALVVVAFLIWLLVFSGLVFDRTGDRDVNRIPGTRTETTVPQQPETGTGETIIPTTIAPSPVPTAT